MMDHSFNSAFLPLIIIFIFMFAENSANQYWIVIRKRKGERGLSFMSEYLKKYIGKKCFVSTGSFGSSITGNMTAIEDKWIEIETKEGKPKEIINLDFVQRIRILK